MDSSNKAISFRRWIVLLLWCCLFPAISAAQQVLGPQNRSIEFTHINLGPDITHFTAYTILRDRQGYMWFGTDEGALRYYGYNTTHFKNNPLDTTSLAGNLVHKIFQDSRGKLWFGTIEGLSSFDPDHNRFKRFPLAPDHPQGLLGKSVNDIFEDRHGDLWIATWGGLNRLSRGSDTFMHFRQESDSSAGLPDFRVMSVNEDPYGILWAATLNGLCAIERNSTDNARFTHFRSIPGNQNSLYGNSAYWIHRDRKNRLWAGTHSGFLGINRPPPADTGQNLDQVGFKRILPLAYDGDDDEIIWKVAEDYHGNLWIASWGNGLLRYNPESRELKRFRHQAGNSASLSDNTVQSLYCDPDSIGGGLWAGTLHGVDVFFPKKRKFAHLSRNPQKPASLSNNHIHSLLVDSRDDLWVGTMGGLNRLPRGANGFRHYLAEPGGLSANLILSLYEDRRGELWIGTFEGLHRFDRNSDEFVQDEALKLVDDRILRVFAFAEDEQGHLWLGTRHGLIRYHPEKKMLRKYNRSPADSFSLPDSDVRALLFDRQQRLWIGTVGGLALLENTAAQAPPRFRHFSYLPDNPAGLASPAIWQIYQDSRGDIWVAGDRGLNRLANAESPKTSKWRFDHFSEADGLAADYVSAIVEDDAGYLWLTTTRGLSRFDPVNKIFSNYDAGDGLQSNDFSTAAYFKTARGKLLLGGINGLNIFHPDSLPLNTHIPPLVFTDFRIFDRPVQLEQDINALDAITLSHRENFFSFEFAALDYTEPEKNRYAYRMDGFDSGWIYSGSRRYASYTNLDPGNYVFRIKAANNDGLWNEAGRAIDIRITPPFWQTWWFRLLAFVGVFAMLGLFHRYRMRQLQKIQQVRAGIAEDLHDEIASSLASVKLYSEVLRKKSAGNSDESHTLLSRIGALSGEISDGIHQIIWSVDPRQDQLAGVIERLVQDGRQLFEAAGIRFEPQVQSGLENISMSAARRRAVYLIFKEAMNNIVRHSGCQRVEFKCRHAGKITEFVIHDDGSGFDRQALNGGHGLMNMKNRAEAIEAKLQIDGNPGTGCRLVLKFKAR